MSRVPASDRLRRILAMLPWMMAQPDGASVDEACTRFGLTRDQLLAELEGLRMVGVYPYSPDTMLDWWIDGDRITIVLADWFAKPLRLTPEQALALVATGRSLTSVPGVDPEGPLARGLTKVADVLGVDPDTIDVDLGRAEPGVLAVLRDAAATAHQVEIDYYTHGRDERSTRVVEPYRVFADQGQWYLDGFCRSSEAERLFRVDRVLAARPLESTFEPPTVPPDASVFQAGPETPRVTLELDPSARWVAEQYPVDDVAELESSRLRVTLAVSGRSWLERLLLGLGPAATVVAGPDDLLDAGPDAAHRVLARYRSTAHPAAGTVR